MSQRDPLFEPIRIGPKTLKNRFYQVPQCTGAGVDRPGANAAHRAVKAEGGWVALNTEACNIHPESDQTTSTVTAIWDQGDVINHRLMTDEVHKWNALAGVELCYGAGIIDNLGLRHAPEAMYQFASPWMPQTYTHEADIEDLERVQDMYLAAARRGRDAGFDIVYVHGTHGCFPVQTLSRHFNRRSDKYGGSLENRARFWLEVLEQIKREVGDDCAIATRFSIDQLSGPEGVEAGDEGLAFVELVTRAGLLDLLDVNVSSLQEWGEDAAPSRFQASNHQAPWIREVKRIAKVPVVGVGRFTSPDDMLAVLRSGQLDIIGCARPSIADPWLPRKIDEGRAEDIRECIACNMCIARFEPGGPDRLHPESDGHGGVPPRLAPGALRTGARSRSSPRGRRRTRGPRVRAHPRPARLLGAPGRGASRAGRPSAPCRRPARTRRMGPGDRLPGASVRPDAGGRDHARGRAGHRR